MLQTALRDRAVSIANSLEKYKETKNENILLKEYLASAKKLDNQFFLEFTPKLPGEMFLYLQESAELVYAIISGIIG